MSSLWERITKDLQEGVITISEKAGVLLKSGAEALRGGMEAASEKAALSAKLAKLKWEQNLLQREIEKSFTALGGQAYELYVAGNLGELSTAAQDKFESLRKFEAELESKEKEIESLPKLFVAKSGSENWVEDLRKDLEGGEGAILQVKISERSPAAGRKLQDLELPRDLVVGAIARGEEIILPEGGTAFMPGDRVTILGKKAVIAKASELLGGTGSELAS